jgi:hypothetical protein
MTSMSLDFPETDRIAALLDEVTGRAERRIVPPPLPNGPPPDDSRHGSADNDVPSIRVSVRKLLAEANWRNQAPPAPVVLSTTPKPETAEPGPLPAPFGVLSIGTMFALINWRNQPDARPLPLIQPPPPPGAELTVGAVMATFGWE